MLNPQFLNAGVLPAFHSLSPHELKFEHVTSIVYGHADVSLKFLSRHCMSILDAKPQMASINKVHDVWRRSAKERELENILRTRVYFPDWLCLYYFDSSVGDLLQDKFHVGFKAWLHGMLLGRHFADKRTVLLALPGFREHARHELICGTSVVVGHYKFVKGMLINDKPG